MAKKALQTVKKAENTGNGKVQKKTAAPLTPNPKKNLNKSQKISTPKNTASAAKKPNKKESQVYNSSSDDDDEEETSQQVAEEQSDDDSSENGSDVDQANGADEADDSDEKDEEAGEGEGEDASEDDDEEEDDSEEENEEPTEEPIVKAAQAKPETPKASKKSPGNDLSPIKSVIPKSYDNEAIVKVSNIPPKYKPTDIMEAFMGFGTVAYIQKVANQLILVAFENAEQAKAALAANGQVFIAGNKVVIKPKAAPATKTNPEDDESLKRSIVVRSLPRPITEQEITEHFADCGKIENIKLNAKLAFAVVRFSDVDAVAPALKLHNSQLKGEYILVSKHRIFSNNEEKRVEDKRTVILMNTKEQKSVSPEELKKVFKKCGEIERIDIYCKKVLAFIVFAKVESVAKALQLNGKTVDGLEIKVEECRKNQRSPVVFLQNINKMSSDEAVKEFFSSCGTIRRFTRHPQSTTAIVEFADLDGYCKAFLLDSDTLDFNRIFVEPFSTFKQRILSKKGPNKPNHMGGKRKAPFNQGPKKFNNQKNAKKMKVDSE